MLHGAAVLMVLLLIISFVLMVGYQCFGAACFPAPAIHFRHPRTHFCRIRSVAARLQIQFCTQRFFAHPQFARTGSSRRRKAQLIFLSFLLPPGILCFSYFCFSYAVRRFSVAGGTTTMIVGVRLSFID